MRDRQPTPGKEGRVKLTYDDGTTVEVTMEMADQPVEAGTALNKRNLLQDATAALYDLPEEVRGNPVVDDVLKYIGTDYDTLKLKIDLILNGLCYMDLKLQFANGQPAVGVPVEGFKTKSGDSTRAFSDSQGIASGYISQGSGNLSISRCADINNATISYTAEAGNLLKKTFTVSPRNYLFITTTNQYAFSANVLSIDATIVGGGGKGGSGGRHVSGNNDNSGAGGGGGAGGGVTIATGLSFALNTMYSATVGAAGGSSSFLGRSGAAGSSGSNGGNAGESWLGGRGGGPYGGTGGNNSTKGGDGGTNSGGGGGVAVSGWGGPSVYGGNGGAGISGYSSYTSMTTYGGGGGGAPNGSGGGNGGSATFGAGGNASSYGGGGAGGTGGYSSGYDGGSGYQGCIALRMHLINT